MLVICNTIYLLSTDSNCIMLVIHMLNHIIYVYCTYLTAEPLIKQFFIAAVE